MGAVYGASGSVRIGSLLLAVTSAGAGLFTATTLRDRATGAPSTPTPAPRLGH
jgi:hypothetical protein